MIRITRPLWIQALLLLSGLFSTSLYAASASVTSNKVVQDEVFQLRITAEEQLDSDAVDFSVLSKDFYLGRPNFGSYTNYVNGVKSVRSEWTIALAPLKAGTVTIPTFQVGSETTEPIQLTVTTDADSSTKPEDLVEYQVTISRQELYPGETAHLDTRLLIKTELRQLKDAKIIQPKIEGADQQAIELKPKGKASQYQSILNGVEVTVVDQSYDLIAKQTGKYIINGPQLKGAIIAQTTNGSAKLMPVTTQQKLLVIDVLDKPENYQGAWLPSPNLTLTQQWLDENGNVLAAGTDTQPLNVGIPLTRQITLTVEGVEQAQLPDIQVTYPETLRLYEEKPVFHKEENRIVMTVKQVLIPKQEGEINLPDISVPWWNTRDKHQATAKVKGLHLSVEKSNTPALSISTPQPTQPAREVVKTETITVNDPGYWPYLTVLFAVLWLLFTGLWFNTWRQNKQRRKTEKSADDIPVLTLLTNAIKQNDTIQAQALFRRWETEPYNQNQTLRQNIRKEMELMMAAAYDPSGKEWNNQDLLRLLKTASKVSQKRQEKEGLAPL
ncbi:BatD family protein [Vibrio albus]|nr:BatD family protein [Vibrio albus]